MIPKRFTPILFGFILSGLMSLIVSGISTVRVAGLATNSSSLWMQAWLIAWLIAFPAVLVAAPLTRRAVERFVSRD